jgi:hypothetical protein
VAHVIFFGPTFPSCFTLRFTWGHDIFFDNTLQANDLYIRWEKVIYL